MCGGFSSAWHYSEHPSSGFLSYGHETLAAWTWCGIATSQLTRLKISVFLCQFRTFSSFRPHPSPQSHTYTTGQIILQHEKWKKAHFIRGKHWLRWLGCQQAATLQFQAYCIYCCVWIWPSFLAPDIHTIRHRPYLSMFPLDHRVTRKAAVLAVVSVVTREEQNRTGLQQ